MLFVSICFFSEMKQHRLLSHLSNLVRLHERWELPVSAKHGNQPESLLEESKIQCVLQNKLQTQ